MNSRATRQKDYYRTLGVSRYASAPEIKQAFKKLALQYHPDRTRGNHRAEERFKEISEAYRVLTDEKKRRDYDLTSRVHLPKPSSFSRWNGNRRSGPEGSVNWAERDLLGDLFFELSKKGVDFKSPSFEQVLFGRRGIFFGEAFFVDFQPNAAQPGPDSGISPGQNGKKNSSPKSFFAWVGEKLRRLFLVKGAKPADKSESVDLHFALPITMFEAIRGGEKRVSLQRGQKTEKLLVKIPPGIKPGMKLRLKGKGKQCRPGTASGDLYFSINIQ